jgi:hypothetical protein
LTWDGVRGTDGQGDKEPDGQDDEEPATFDDKEEDLTDKHLKTIGDVNRSIFFYLIVFTL